MSDRERIGLREKIGRGVAATVLLPAATINIGYDQPRDNLLDQIGVGPAAAHRFMDSFPSVTASQDMGLFEQFDSYLETSYGRALASAAVLGTLALLWSSRKINRETDTESQEKLAIFSSIVAVSFASVLLAESFTDIDSQVPASLFETFVVTQSALSLWRVLQRHRELGKRLPATLMSLSLVAMSTVALAETIK